MYLWKALGTTPVSIETLGAMAVITMIILTSDVTSPAGWWWLFFLFVCFFVLASKRCQGLCSVLTDKK